jgi:hypothetical protein
MYVSYKQQAHEFSKLVRLSISASPGSPLEDVSSLQKSPPTGPQLSGRYSQERDELNTATATTTVIHVYKSKCVCVCVYIMSIYA